MQIINYSINITPKANATKLVRYILNDDHIEMFEKLASRTFVDTSFIIENTSSAEDLISLHRYLFSNKALFDVSGNDCNIIECIITTAILTSSAKYRDNYMFLFSEN